MRLSALLVIALATSPWLTKPAAADGEQPAALMEVRVEPVVGEAIRGRLVGISDNRIEIVVNGSKQSLPIDTVRRIVRERAGQARPLAIRVTTTDGGRLAGDDFFQEGALGVVPLGEGRIELPIQRVRRVAWLAAGEAEPPWLADVPEQAAADLVAVRREEGHAFVECAVAGVSGEHVTVVLEGETIPVARAKVLGIEWLREEAAPGGIAVGVEGGLLSAKTVRWSPEAFLLDDARLPPESLREIDYAVGRTTPLADVQPENVAVEPFFGALAKGKELAAFFAPRTVPDEGDGPATLIVRPQTVITWRVPTESRRFRGALVRNVSAEADALVEVSLALDGDEVFRRRLGPAGDTEEPVAVDLDLADGRRLTLTIDFVAGDIGCGVRLVGGAFEK